MELTIRPATLSDSAGICAIYQSAMGYASLTDAEVASRMAEMQQRGGYFIYVALEDDKVIGFISTQRSMSMEVAGEYMTVLVLAVDAEYRRQGVGRALMERAEADAAQDGIGYFTLTSGFAREGAHAFYQTLGYEKKSFKFIKGRKF